jgi:hypothetical protein
MQKPEVPFFARFLESQESLQVRTDVKAGNGGGGGKGGGGGGWPPAVTLKYPSDDDEDPIPEPL